MIRLRVNRVLVLAAVALGLAFALGVRLSTSDKGVRVLWRPSEQVAEDLSEDSFGADASDPESRNPASSRNLRRGEDDFPFEDLDGGYENGEPGPSAPAPVRTAQQRAPADSPQETPVVSEDGDQKGVTISIPTPPSPVATNDFMGGVTSSNPLIFPTARALNSSVAQWAYGQARGYAMLYALQGEARQVVESQVAALLGARIREPFIGVLIDGTFGGDFAYLKDVITRLNADGRDLSLALYLANGPAQRRQGVGLPGAPFGRITPAEFRGAIRRTAEVRAQYSALAKQARMIFEFNLATNPNARNYGVIMLEDNLDQESFRAALQLAKEQLEGLAVLVRNPCDSCDVPGSDRVTLGQPLEDHDPEKFGELSIGDAFTLDGTGFKYPSGGSTRGISAELLGGLLKDSYVRQLAYFGLWRHQWQGVPEQGPNPLPAERSYIPSTADEIAFEIEMLRAGLPLEQSEDSGDAIVDENGIIVER